MGSERILWIDWMKVIGMYLIIAGHLFPIGYTYLYVFNVPIFFLISGFLCKRDNNNYFFIKKIIFNYIIPIFIIRTIMYFWEKYTYIAPNHFINIIDYWICILKGQQNCIGACWFIYTLILIKLLFQYITNNKLLIAFFICLTIIAIILNVQNIHKNNAVFNITVAYQPFAIGYYLKKYKKTLIAYHFSPFSFILLLSFSLLLIIFCGNFNGKVWLYQNGYGESILLYFLGMIGGSLLLFSVAKILERKTYFYISILSTGNILTLGFHQIFVNITKMQINTYNYISYMLAFIILVLFIPIIIICKSYFPIVLGMYHHTTKNHYGKT